MVAYTSGSVFHVSVRIGELSDLEPRFHMNPLAGLARLPGRILWSVHSYGLLTKCKVKMAGYCPLNACLERRYLPVVRCTLESGLSLDSDIVLTNKGFLLFIAHHTSRRQKPFSFCIPYILKTKQKPAEKENTGKCSTHVNKPACKI